MAAADLGWVETVACIIAAPGSGPHQAAHPTLHLVLGPSTPPSQGNLIPASLIWGWGGQQYATLSHLIPQRLFPTSRWCHAGDQGPNSRDTQLLQT